MKNGNVMGFRGYRFFPPKSSNAKYSTLGTFGGKKPRIILREVQYLFSISLMSARDIICNFPKYQNCSHEPLTPVSR